MNIKPLGILIALALLTEGCGKSPAPTTADSPAAPVKQSPAEKSDADLRRMQQMSAELQQKIDKLKQSQTPIQAEPFHGQVYKSLNGRNVLTLISKDECELSLEGTTLLCKYTKPNDTLRVVTTASGTSQIIYFRFTSQGLEGELPGDYKGVSTVLLSQEQYAAITEQIRRAEDRKAQEKKDSKRETKVILTKSLCQTSEFNQDPDQIILTDVSVKLHYPPTAGGETTDYLFVEHQPNIKGLKVVGDLFHGSWQTRNTDEKVDVYWFDLFNNKIACPTEAEANSVHDAVSNAVSAWNTKFPEAVHYMYEGSL